MVVKYTREEMRQLLIEKINRMEEHELVYAYERLFVPNKIWVDGEFIKVDLEE